MKIKLETLILANLLRNEEFTRKVIPFITAAYFADDTRDVFSTITSYVNKFNALPTEAALKLELEEQNFSVAIVPDLYSMSVKDDTDWLIGKTESWCQNRALEIAIAQSFNIISGNEQTLNKGAIPKILQDALGVSFDRSIGHDYFEDAERRFESLHDEAQKIPFDIESFNEITGGGFEPGSLNVIMASCVSPVTRVKIRFGVNDPFVCIISEVKTLMDNDQTPEVWTPNGWVKILDYLVKPNAKEYLIATDNGCMLSCNKDHMIMTSFGWMSVFQMTLLDGDIHVETERGLSICTITETGVDIPIVDIVIDHPSHAYYTDGIVSHNTGVGKSLIMSHMAASALSMGHDVLYVTLEMAEEKIGLRIDANLMGIDLDDFTDHEVAALMKNLDKIHKKTNGKLIIKQYPPGSANVNHFRALFQEIKLKKKIKPKIAFFDYINICASARLKYGASSMYEMIKSIAEELRGLAIEEHIAIVTATQTNRSGLNNSDVDLSSTSESFGLPQTADFMIAIMQTEDLAKQNQYLCKQLKNRYRDMNNKLRFMIGVDKPTMRIYDIDTAEGLLQEVEDNFKNENSKYNDFEV